MRRYLIIIVFFDLDESGCLNTGSNPDVSYRKVNSSYFCIESGSPLFVFPDVIKRSDVKWVRWIIYLVFRIKGSDFLTHVRSEERRVVKECVSTCRHWWWQANQ